MRIVIDIEDDLVDEWGSLVIHPVSLAIDKSVILLPGFKYQVLKERPTVQIRAFDTSKRDAKDLGLRVLKVEESKPEENGA
jgi:hypothetical protein